MHGGAKTKKLSADNVLNNKVGNCHSVCTMCTRGVDALSLFLFSDFQN